jgi:hypothetical protein
MQIRVKFYLRQSMSAFLISIMEQLFRSIIEQVLNFQHKNT